MTNKKKTNRKYRLHQLLKKIAIRYSFQQKTVYIPFNLDVLPSPIIELQNNHNYSIQTEIIEA